LAMIVIEAGETGGTQEAAKQTMELGKPLFAVKYDHTPAGNQTILDRGAKHLGKNPETKLPNIEKVLNIVKGFQDQNKKGQMNLPLI
ncbi:MAG: hypothetical protein ACPHWV_03705, partial [Candidatus Puniceispirillum sp.]